MTYQLNKPAGSPPCWSMKYQDGDDECENRCRFKESCRPAMLTRIASPIPVQTAQPFPLPNRPFLPAPMVAPTPIYQQAPQLQPVTQPILRPPSTPVHQSPQYQQYHQLPSVHQPPVVPPPITQYQHQNNYAIPDHRNPHPMAWMVRPGGSGPPYYFTQFQGESVRSRLAKNLLLRMLEAVLFELASFFKQWTWPPK
jgi:hypothetical protein